MRPALRRVLSCVLGLLLVLLLQAAALPAQPSVPASDKNSGELVFGMSAPFSGPARTLGVEYYRGLATAFAQVNAQGGAGGWKLKLSARDDGYDPGRAMENTLRFVADERVFALCGYVGTPTAARVLPILRHYESQPLLLLFPLTGAKLMHQGAGRAQVFSLRPTYNDEAAHMVRELLAAGHKRFAIFYQADMFGRNVWDGVRQALDKQGLALVAEATYRRGAGYGQDFRSEVEILRAAAPDVIITAATAAPCAAFIRDARGAGLTTRITAFSSSDADSLLRLLQAQSKATGRDYTQDLVLSQTLPSTEDLSLNAVRLFRKAMDEYGVAPPAALVQEQYQAPRYSMVGFEGYLAGRTLAQAVARMGKQPRPEALRAALTALRDLDLGLDEKLSFASGSTQGLTRTYLVRFMQGHFQSLEHLERTVP